MGCCYFENKEEKYELPLDFFDKIDDEKDPLKVKEVNGNSFSMTLMEVVGQINNFHDSATQLD